MLHLQEFGFRVVRLLTWWPVLQSESPRERFQSFSDLVPGVMQHPFPFMQLVISGTPRSPQPQAEKMWKLLVRGWSKDLKSTVTVSLSCFTDDELKDRDKTWKLKPNSLQGVSDAASTQPLPGRVRGKAGHVTASAVGRQVRSLKIWSPPL